MTKKPTIKTLPKSNPLVTEYAAACKANGYTNETEISAMTTYFQKCDNEVRFVRKNITPVFSKILLRIFSKVKLHRIIFHGCFFQDQNFLTKFATDLNKLQISQIYFDYCPIQRDCITLYLSAPNLDSLSIRGNVCLASEKGNYNQSLNNFYNSLARSPLKMLDLTGCNLGDEGASSVARVLYFNTSLRCLNLSSNKIGDDGAIALSYSLSFYFLTDQEIEIHEKLQNDEVRSKISDDGADLIKKKKGGKSASKKATTKTKKGQPAKPVIDRTYSFDPNLPVIPAVFAKFNTCVLLEDGRMYIQGNTTLTSLILDDNKIEKMGYAQLSEMLSKNTKLVNFSIKNNPDIKDEDVALISRKFEQPSPVE